MCLKEALGYFLYVLNASFPSLTTIFFEHKYSSSAHAPCSDHSYAGRSRGAIYNRHGFRSLHHVGESHPLLRPYGSTVF